MPMNNNDYVGVANWIYGVGGGPLTNPPIPSNNTKININGKTYIVLQSIDNLANSYQGAVLKDVTDNVVVVVNRGSQEAEDFAIDLKMAETSANAQWDDADRLALWANTYASINKISSIVSVGHSLGGTLTQLQAAKYGWAAVTFNAYGAGEVAAAKGITISSSANITNYRELFDLVSDASTQIGQVITVANQGDLPYLGYDALGAVKPLADLLPHIGADHSLKNFFGTGTNASSQVYVMSQNVLGQYNDIFSNQQIARSAEIVKFVGAELGYLKDSDQQFGTLDLQTAASNF